ncbi:ATP-binding SpoIIE family protein phosphatase [Victivallis lenta]|jgi:response regulator receiver modulated serine phosphatase|uniref:ATP-binding SpoIIE family protein phosphatase n=1 Tax=Victivallis lenta TaxID=2606640 RepID=UPI0015AA5CE8|nr:SpoIIE family protein phosphatase [Victivallis lenta]
MSDRKYNVLVLDDEKFILLTVSACLKNGPFQVTTADHAEQALDAFKQKRFDAVLSDIMMDSVDGFKFRDMIRNYNKRIPIIFLTSLMDDIDNSLINQIMKDSYSYYLNKNFTRTSLLEKLDQVVRAYQAQNEISQLEKKIESDLELATQVQTAMLPPWIRFTECYEFSFIYRPLFKISGDLFEWIPIDPQSCLCVFGDISGHGIHSALTMTAVQSILKQMITIHAPDELRPDRILRQLNDFFCEKLNMCSYMTCLIGIWNFRDNRLIYHNAGHPDLLCFHAETGEWFDPNPRKRGSLPVGMLREADYLESNNVELEFADDTVFLAHSDGLWDIGTHPNDQAGVDVKTFQQLASAAVKDNYVVEIPFRLSGALEQIGYDTPMDDYSLFALKKLSSEVGRTIFLRQIPPDMASIDRATQEAAEFIEKQLHSEELAGRVEILLSEFLVNIFKHGLGNYKKATDVIAVLIRGVEEGVNVTVLDRGRFWENGDEDSTEEVDQLLAELSRKKAESGRGIPLIRKLSPQISRRHLCGLNETIFTVKYENAEGREERDR